jgi:hypothetical protein
MEKTLQPSETLDMSEQADKPVELPADPHELAPADYCDPVIEAYKKDVDRTLRRENLKLTVEERIRKAISFHKSIEAWRAAGERMRRKEQS